MKVSHSRVGCFVKCPYQYKLRYIDKSKALPKYDPQDALILGSSLHLGIEKNTDEAIKFYYNSYPVITDAHINEAIKLEYWLPKIKDEFHNRYGSVYEKALHEVKIEDKSFIGFIDLLVPVDDNTYDLYDFKYSNNVDNYMDSEQLHLYKYHFELLNPTKKIHDMYFMFVPKCNIKIKYKNKTNSRDETLREFRKRIINDLDSKKIEFVKIDYNDNKVFDFYTDVRQLIDCNDYIKKATRLCDWCEYQRYCESEGKDDLDMVLPSTERRTIEKNGYKKIWIYGLPFSGKTYLANEFETPLMLNTDGNFKQVDAPVIRIIDEVRTEGRMTKRKYAWEVFQETVDELEKKNNDFKTIIVDLIEDVYDACRIKVCVDKGWEHESDDSFKAYDIVRSEFLRTLKRLLNLDYNIVLISHEDTSRDITKKTGDKITAIKPNLADKLALKVAGMVDMCFRIVNNEGNRTISFKSNEVEFGGGRLTVEAKEIPCNYNELMKVYDKANVGVAKSTRVESKKVETPATEQVETATVEPTQVETPEKKTRTRKPREVVEEAKEEVKVEEPKEQVEEEKPVRRRRRVSE